MTWSPQAGGLLLLLAARLALPATQPSIVLISVDTLRADRLSCYGHSKARTPHMDELARGGTLFSRVNSPVPLTLPAHMSLLSSTYPYRHGVEENGQQIATGVGTLPGVLKARGYHTAAFIGGYVLDARFGLNQGFDVYDSPFHLSPHPGEEPPEIKRPAEAVLHAAAEWIKAEAGHAFFAFIHLYDAHQPYSHGSYDGEVAYVDRAIGNFRHDLAAQLKDALIILTSDHGESLGEHGEDTHGYFIYQSTLWVPLLVHWPAAGSHPARVDDPASLIDIAPTVLDFVGAQAPAGFQGRSLMKAVDAPVYSESMYARDHLGCDALRAIRLGRYKYIAAPKPELYDLEADPGELHNRYDQDRPLAQKLRAQLLALADSARRPAPNPASAEVLARLRSLGYLGGGPARSASGIDPKDRLQLYLRYGRAIRLANTGRLTDAIGEFRKVLDEDRQNVLAHFYVGVCYYRMRRFDEAVTALNDTLSTARNYPPAEELLGSIWLLKKDYARARQQFEHLAAVAPGNYGAHYNLGMLALQEGRSDEALHELQAASRADPNAAQAHSALGSLYQSRGDPVRAGEEFRQAVALDPDDQTARKSLEQLRGASRQ
jgi:Flp pilus assembly protein TadD